MLLAASSRSRVLPAIWRRIFRALQRAYAILLGLTLGAPPRGMPPLKDSLLTESAASLAERIRSRKVTSATVVRAHVHRIREANGVVNCVAEERFREALEEAERADELVRSGRKTKEDLERETPFLGVPFAADASMAVRGLLTAGGTAGIRAEADAAAVASMRAAGAVLLATTNVSEARGAGETNNPDFGRTGNPYGTNRSVGGSSGGAPCLVASAGCPLGISLDWGGSLRGPCAFVGVFGHKPSAERTSLDGIFPEVEPSKLPLCGVGPVSRNAGDLLPALEVLAGTSATELNLGEPVDVKRLRYFFMEDDGGSPLSSAVAEDVRRVIRRAVDHFATVHGAAVRQVHLAQTKDSFRIWKSAAGAEGPPQRGASPGKGGRLNVFGELWKAVFGRSLHSPAFLLTSLLEESLRRRDGSRAAELARDRGRLFDQLQELLGADGVLVCPTQPTAAFLHNESPARAFDRGYAAVFNALGLPATHCPAGLDSRGLPVGFQVVAALNQDRLAIAVAVELEKAFGGWTPPPTAGTFTLRNAAFLNAANERLKVL